MNKRKGKTNCSLVDIAKFYSDKNMQFDIQYLNNSAPASQLASKRYTRGLKLQLEQKKEEMKPALAKSGNHSVRE